MLSKRIYELRISFNWTQVQLSQKLGVTKQTVSNWENDNIQPSIEMLVKIADYFNVSVDFLIGRCDQKEKPATVSGDELNDTTREIMSLLEDMTGILPNPKYDEAQEEYCHIISTNWCPCISVPVTITGDALERTTVLLEALFCYSDGIVEAYYDVNLSTKLVRDEESADMFDIIFETKYCK